MRTREPNHLRAFVGAPKSRFGTLGKATKWAGVGIGATLAAILLIALGSADTIWLVLIILKATHNITWPWLALLAPYIVSGIVGIVAIVVMIILTVKEFRRP